MRKVLFILSIAIPAFCAAQQPAKQDSAVIVFKNVTKDTLTMVRAVIKGQDVITINLKPNEEYSQTISTTCVAPDCQITYRFEIKKSDGSYGVLTNDDYKAMVGNIDITTGTYKYSIGWGKNPVEQWPNIKLEKVN
jgi:hypothetical protein